MWYHNLITMLLLLLRRVDNGQRDYWIFDIGAEHTMKYKLPPGVVCEAGCVLQWNYYSMQSCIEPGCDRKYCGGYADGDNVLYNSNPGFCGRTGAQAEFFRNCADIRILPAGAHYMGSGSEVAGDFAVEGTAGNEAAAAAAASGGVSEATSAANVDGEVIAVAPAIQP
jgi:hypothetical protein